jgi:hypothetical protein
MPQNTKRSEANGSLLTTTNHIVAVLYKLGALASRLRTFCRIWLVPDTPEYRARILRERERIAERIAFYTPTPVIRHHGAIRPPRKGASL